VRKIAKFIRKFRLRKFDAMCFDIDADDLPGYMLRQVDAGRAVSTPNIKHALSSKVECVAESL